MTNVYRDRSKNGWRLETIIRGMKRKLWIGDISKAQAESFCGNVHALKLAADTGTTPEAHVLRWTRKIDKRFATRFAEWGLIETRDEAATFVLMSKWCKDYLDDPRNKDWATSTRYQMTKVSDLLVAVIGDKPLDKVNEADAELFAEHVYGLSETSESHAGKQIKRARQFFNYAVKKRVLDRNPFSAVRASTQIDESRKAFVTVDAAERILERLPSQLWRVIFVLGRFAGLRVPSEPLQLKWTDINWETNQMLIHSPKQRRHMHRRTRLVPMSPVVQRELMALSEMAKEKEVYVINQYRSASTAQFRKPLINAIEKAGFPVWPKLWMNLRASCRNDWKKLVDVSVVNEWLGHDTKVGEKHYDRVTHDDVRKITTPTITPTNDQTIKKHSD